jgi:hypothetical protein
LTALRSQHRGLVADGAAPDEAAGIDEVPATQLPTAMPRPWLDEGGQSDLPPANSRGSSCSTGATQGAEPLLGGTQLPGDAGCRRWPQGRLVDARRGVDQPSRTVRGRRRLGDPFDGDPGRGGQAPRQRAEEQLIDQVQQQSGTNAITGSGSDLSRSGRRWPPTTPL